MECHRQLFLSALGEIRFSTSTKRDKKPTRNFFIALFETFSILRTRLNFSMQHEWMLLVDKSVGSCMKLNVRTDNQATLRHFKLHKTVFHVALSFSFSFFPSNYRMMKNYFMHYGCSPQKTHGKSRMLHSPVEQQRISGKSGKFFNLIHVISSAVASVVRPGNFWIFGERALHVVRRGSPRSSRGKCSLSSWRTLRSSWYE